MPNLLYTVFPYIPTSGLTLLLALLAFTYFHQPVGLVVALMIATPGFFLPLSMHRIPHPAGWPNPLMLGALVAGVGVTCLIYLFRVFFDILTTDTIQTSLFFFKGCIASKSPFLSYLLLNLLRGNNLHTYIALKRTGG